jgi:hypothetical protein
MTNHKQDTDLRDSTPNSGGPDGAAGGMGVSSERVGHAGPGQQRTDGVLDTSVVTDDDEDAPPERSPGGPEDNPVGLEPKAGYPSLDPRSDS